MKYFIIAVCLIGAIVADHDKKGGDKKGHEEDITKTAGCEKYESVKKLKATECCKSLPEVFNKSSGESCEKECEGKGYCCKYDCIMKENSLLDAAGKLDSAKLKAFLKTAVKDATYPVDTIVDGCIAKAPKEVEEWKKKQAEKADKSDKKDKSAKTENKCVNPENGVVVKCIRKELILNCPDWTKSADCDNLMAFAKSCPKYPIRGGCNKGDDKKTESKKDGKKNKKDGKKEE